MKVKEYIFNYQEHFRLESGGLLPGFQLKYTTLGELNEGRSNVVWVCHALTGSSNFTEWWADLFSEDGPFDPNEYFIICANSLGGCYGSTGPLSTNPKTNRPYYHDFPLITNRDVVQAFDLLRQHLGLKKIHTLLGGSLGGQQALEWAVQQPDLVDHLIPIACNALHSPWGIAINEAQRLAIESDSSWRENSPMAGQNGLAAARAMSMITFRTFDAFQSQTEQTANKLDDYKAASYQRYQGEKLVNRFNAFSYWTLTKAMDNHHVARHHLNLTEALGRIKSKTLVIGIESDLLFPVQEQRITNEAIANAQLVVIQSDYGHDGFLVETKQLKSIIQQFFIVQSKYILQ